MGVAEKLKPCLSNEQCGCVRGAETTPLSWTDMINGLGVKAGFYGCPVLKGIVASVSATSLIFGILLRGSLHDGLVFSILRALSMPSAGVWVASVVLLHSSAPLERRVGSHRFIQSLLFSAMFAMGLHGAVMVTVPSLWASLPTTNGVAVCWILGGLVFQLLASLRAPHAVVLLRMRVSSHVIPLLLAVAVAGSSLSLLTAALCGAAGGLVSLLLGPLPLPSLLSKAIMKLVHLAGRESQPQVFSGASLVVQRQQQTDMLEALMISLQARQDQQIQRQRVAAPYRPSQDEIHQLTAMGFREEDVLRALSATRGNVPAAVQMLTSATHRLQL